MPIRRPLLLVTLFAALVGAAPLWLWLDLPMRICLPTALLLGAWGDYRERALLRPGVATLLTLAGSLWYAAHFSTTEIVAPATSLLALLLSLRLLTEKSGRHLLQIFVLALLALAASSLYSLSSAFLLFLTLEIIAIALGLVLLCHEEAAPGTILAPGDLKQLFAVGLGLPLVSLLFVPPLFFILPRTQFPLWNFLNQPDTAISGISDHVEPGSFSSLAQSRRVVLRVEMLQLPDSALYWRTMVLNTPEGNAWVRRPPPREENDLPVGTQQVEQRLYIEPTGDRFLPGLDAVSEWNGIRAERSSDGLIVAQRPLTQRDMARATSRSAGRLLSSRPFPPDFYLTVPQNVSPRLRATVAKLVTPEDDARTRIDVIEAFFLTQQYSYSLSELPGGANPLEDFIFGKKTGYCEHFATAFTVMLRLAGVPARLVGGYYGGEYSAFGGYYAISEDQAHLWVEALVDRHWERLDPTRLAGNAERVGNIRSPRLRGLSQWADAFNFYWNRAVINYDLSQQLDWLRRTGHATSRWNLAATFKAIGRAVVLPTLLVIFLVLIRLWLRTSTEERLLRTFLRLLRQRGIATNDASLGLRTLALRYPHSAARDFADLYNAILYSDRRATPDDLCQLKSLLRLMRSATKNGRT